MKIDLTYKCSMGCTHCMSDCKSDGIEMSLETLHDVIDFYLNNHIYQILLSGGEIFEHSKILECLEMIFQKFAYVDRSVIIILLTNGRELSSNIEYLEFIKKYKQTEFYKDRILIQVTDDSRFYPIPLTNKQIYRLNKLGAIIDTVPSNPYDKSKCLYPQGRALVNHSESNWNTIGPKCANCRLMVNQMNFNFFEELVAALSLRGKMCTPSISPKGEIKLGESALCPPTATIYDSTNDIFNKINKFNCQACKISWDKLKSTNKEAYNILTSS